MFEPSEILASLLLPHVSRIVTSDSRQRVIRETCGLLRKGFYEALANTFSAEKVLIDGNYCLCPEFFAEIKKFSNVHPTADFSGSDFRLRFAEEIYIWCLFHPEEAAKIGLTYKKGVIFLD